MSTDWDYLVSGYYGPGGRAGTRGNPNKDRPGEREGDRAIEVGCGSESVAEAEVLAFKLRDDIGMIHVRWADGSRILRRNPDTGEWDEYESRAV